jgi:membrane-bound metal-dependent hydrolase YbcI (DUF457 family)
VLGELGHRELLHGLFEQLFASLLHILLINY